MVPRVASTKCSTEMIGRHVRHRADAHADADDAPRRLTGGDRLDLADEVLQQGLLVHQASSSSSRRMAAATFSAAAATGSESPVPVSKLAPSIP